MSRKLVAYFSASGVTARVAKEIAAVEGADCFEIRPEAPYTKEDLDWTDKRSRSTLEMSDLNCRPALTGRVVNMADYDVVFVGFPIWWYVEPRIIDTFLEAYDFAGKTIVPFATSGGSGLGQAPIRMQQLAPGSEVKSGRLLNGHQSTRDLREFAEKYL